jgi:hypothetical protein
MDQYDRLTAFLNGQIANEIRLTFNDVSAVMGVSLPQAARTHRQWWENQVSTIGRQCHAWLNAGWNVRDVRLGQEYVVFGRSTIQIPWN